MKKKWLIILSLAFVVILLLAFVATIPTLSDNSYSYFVTSSGQAVITGFDKTYWGNLSITRQLDGFPVTVIDRNAFSGCTRLTSVTIPNSVTRIGDCAFGDCTRLTSVAIPNSVTRIGRWVFSGCTSLTRITVDTANPKYSSLDGVLFNKEQTSLIKYPYGRSGTYMIPDSVTDIGDCAFGDCTRLTSVAIPNSVTNIGRWVFSGCTSLTRITVDTANPKYSSQDGVLFNKEQTSLIECPYGRSGTYMIPDSVITIGDCAFGGCTRLTSVAIPNSVTKIGRWVFSGCTSLTRITVDTANPKYSSQDGVLFNKALNTLILCPYGRSGTYMIPDSVITIGDGAFGDCTRLTSVAIPDSVITIGDGAFGGCTSLTRITVDTANPKYSSLDGVLFNKEQTSLIKYPYGRSGTYMIPDSVTNIGFEAFAKCARLNSVTIPDSVITIGDLAFYECARLTSVTIPDGVANIGDFTFSECTSLVSVTIPDSVTNIGDFAFCGCTSLVSVTIPDSVKAISKWAFAGCTRLTSVTIPDSVASIGESAFSYCTSLTRVTIRGGVTNIDGGAFGDCTALTNITVDATNPNYSSLDGVLFNKAKTTLIQCPGGRNGTYTIPNSVTTIGARAFDGCIHLTSVTIPDSVTTIGDGAFEGCTRLTSVTIPDSVTTIGDGAFARCTALINIFFAGNAPTFGNWVFPDTPATLYYRPGTAGWWNATYSDYPIKLWVPAATP